MTRNFFLKSLVVCLLLLVLPSGCNEARSNLFRPLGLTHGGGPIKRNQDLVVRFSKPLGSDLVPRRAVLVRNAEGTLVETKVITRGHHLVISPLSPFGWPETETLTLRINAAVAGRGLVSLGGEPNVEGLEQVIPVDPRYRRLDGVLELVYSDPPDGAREIRVGPDGGNPFVIRLAFNAPIDQDSLRNGIQVLDADRRAPLVALDGASTVEVLLDQNDPRRVVVRPFGNPDGLFSGGTLYAVRLTKDLRSIDGRRLARTDGISFRTRDGEDSSVIVDFSQRGTVSPGSPLQPGADGVLRPVGREVTVEVGGAPNGTAREIFGSSPSQSQILIPGDDLSRMGLPDSGFRFLLSGLRFDLDAPLPHAGEIDGLVVTLDYLPFPREKEGGLSDVFTANEEGQGLATQGPRVMRLADDPTRFVLPRGAEAIELEFAEPFVYDGSGRSLVLGIQVPYGVSSPVGLISLPVKGHVPESADAAAGRNLLVGSDGQFVLSAFRPRLAVTSVHFPAAETRWFRVSAGIPEPRYYRVRNTDVQAAGDEGLDFDVFFQGGVPTVSGGGRLDDASVQPSGRWSLVPQSLDRFPAFRMRVQFRPRVRGSDEPPPEVHRIVMRYKER